MRDPAYRPLAGAARATSELRPPGAEEALADVTRDRKAFTALVRTRIFTFLRAWSLGQHAAALDSLDPRAEGEEGVPTPDADALKAAREAYGVEHPHLRFDPEARNQRHTHVAPSDDGRSWRVQQVLVDPEQHNDWMAEFEVDLAASRELSRAVVNLRDVRQI